MERDNKNLFDWITSEAQNHRDQWDCVRDLEEHDKL